MTGFPDVDRILERARIYHRDVYEQTGIHPTDWWVSEEDYAYLCRYDRSAKLSGCMPSRFTSPSGRVIVYGMTVHLRAFHTWQGSLRMMKHGRFDRISPLLVWQDFPLEAPIPPICETQLPMVRCETCVCPCGQVVWDMSTCTAWSRETAVYQGQQPWSRPMRVETPAIDINRCTLEEWTAKVDALLSDEVS